LLDRIIQSTTQRVATTLSSTQASTNTSPLPTTTTRGLFDAGINAFNSGFNSLKDAVIDTTTTSTTTSTTTARPIFNLGDSEEDESTTTTTAAGLFGGFVQSVQDTIGNIADLRPNPTSNIDHEFENLADKFDMPHAEAFHAGLSTIAPFHLNATSCERVNIMGTIVADSTPYLYPFIIEYSLIGAAVIFVMWKHIGRYAIKPDEDLEHRLEVMLSRRAVALAQSNSGRVDCVGSSKGLFFGLLLLVGSTCSLIAFFVLIKTNEFRVLAYYLADASHAVLMIFAILAILIGFCR
jgi:hypothetical protein